MDLTLGQILISVRNYLLLRLDVLARAKLQIHFVVRVVAHMTRGHIFGVALDDSSGTSIDSADGIRSL